jgi:hypothetical protein
MILVSWQIAYMTYNQLQKESLPYAGLEERLNMSITLYRLHFSFSVLSIDFPVEKLSYHVANMTGLVTNHCESASLIE